jgi:hypothetical protein
LSDLLHGHAGDQDIMDQRRAVYAEFPLTGIEPQHRLALTLRNRFPRSDAVDIFARRINRLRSALRPLPVVLECTAALVLCFVDLTMRMQPPQRIIADRAQGNDLLT